MWRHELLAIKIKLILALSKLFINRHWKNFKPYNRFLDILRCSRKWSPTICYFINENVTWGSIRNRCRWPWWWQLQPTRNNQLRPAKSANLALLFSLLFPFDNNINKEKCVNNYIGHYLSSNFWKKLSWEPCLIMNSETKTIEKITVSLNSYFFYQI